MAVIAKVCHVFLYSIVGDKLATIIAIFIGVITYFMLLVRTGSLTYEDFKILPKGEKIANKLVKLKLLKIN